MNNNQINQNQTNVNNPANPLSTQNSLEIAELREGMVVMRDGSFRAVVACKSINFDLMSAREREGVEYSYQSFLNALTFPIQILVRSQRVDIEPYLNRLAEIQVAQDNMLLSDLMEDYINFIDSLSRSANIMDKSFFIVIPYYPSGDITNLKGSAKGFFGKIFAKPGAQVSKIDRNTWDKAREEIKKRVDSITGGLYQMGIKSVQLNTKELGELYYNVYNPDTAVYEPLGDFRDTASLFVRKAEGERPNQGGF
ncbi:hypothetical protein HG452_002525 [Candidatus Saccharibacteria bacterium]|jgi:hypothetical protein|nr:hypothetical protein [Candidatus Saccharibacteria bacterium]